jgi:hypothetical protein
MTVPETVPVMVVEPVAGVGGAVVLPPPDPPPLHELRASKNVAQITNLLNKLVDIFIDCE